MQLHLLLTNDIYPSKPDTCKIIMDFGRLTVIFDNDLNDRAKGLHCVVEDTTENMIKWLSPFDGIVVGNGNPMMEKFTIQHIKKELIEKQNGNQN